MTRPLCIFCAALGLLGHTGAGRALTLDLPPSARVSVTKTEALGSYPLPIAGFSDGQMQTRPFEGPLTRTAWQIDAPGQTTLELMAPLRAQLVQDGFSVVLDCDAASCGGFDFRYGTPLLPEPDMHVDLGDYRFVSATKGDQAISLMVSRTAAIGFVQMTHVGADAAPSPLMAAAATASTGQVALAAPSAIPIDRAAAPADLGASLLAGSSVVLDDLVFASGASSLSDGVYPSLVALAAWLKDNPQARIALVGHTDASGSLEGNVALSRKRAQSVRARLGDRHDAPLARIDAEGVGYLSPRASNLTEEGRDRNRRVEVMMTSTPGVP